MATTRRTTGSRVWLWRWRRNPIRRRSDRLEAWIVLVTWLFVLVAGVLAGLAAAGAMEDGLAGRRAHSYPVRAVLAQDAARTPQPVPDYSDGSVWAKVRWTGTMGVTQTGLAKVEPGLKAGAPVTVWTDRAGELVSKPASEAQAQLEASIVGVLVGLSAGGGVLVCGRLARGCLDRQRMEAWDREWERVGPRWRRTIG
ncbi:hypothetical protein [Streptomyces sp. NPDC001530]|uniref:Rv1733c family protein n=1 Tax=Streptomyces sp. NPDC001530 TaxID=3364582 RepID=UPI0036B8B2DE